MAQAAEAAGFESLWTVEHTVVPGGYGSAYPYDDSGKMAGGRDDIPLPDPLIWMAYVAGVTEAHQISHRHHDPAAAQPSHRGQTGSNTGPYVRRGRILLGIGVGWLKEEFDALGVPFEARGRRTDEYMLAMRELWGAEKPTFDGEFVSFKDAYCRPQPANGQVPIIVGGHSNAAARRVGRLGDGFFPARGASD